MYYIFGLVVIYLLSKEIYIINEESLVALSFVTFILLSYNAISSLVSAELDSRADQIRKEFQFLVSARDSSLQVLLEYYKKQLALFEEIVGLVEWLKQRIIETMAEKQNRLRHWMVAQQKSKLTSLVQKERALLIEWREKTVDVFSAKVVKQATLRARCLKESIELLQHSSHSANNK